MAAGLLQLLLDNLIAMTPPLPAADAICHRGLVPQDKCGRCSRIAAALAAIELAQLLHDNGDDPQRELRLAKRRAARAQRKAADGA